MPFNNANEIHKNKLPFSLLQAQASLLLSILTDIYFPLGGGKKIGICFSSRKLWPSLQPAKQVQNDTKVGLA